MTITDDVEVDEEEEETCPDCGEPEDSYGNCSCEHCVHCNEKMSGWGSICPICEQSCPGCCECCESCGCSSCECCDECGYSGCDCARGEFGQSLKVGWEHRGIEAAAKSATDQWRQVWPEVDADNFDLCQEASDFYLLEAITNGFVNSNKILFNAVKPATPEQLFAIIGVDDERTTKHLATLRDSLTAVEPENAPHPLEITLRNVIDEARTLFSRKVENADNIFRAYFHMAVAGEARHHQAMKARILSGNRDRAWSGWRSIYEQVGPEALMDLHDLFLEFSGGGYGGPPWAEACKILYSREIGTLGPTDFLNRKMFVDRAWTLEHNGGCFLNKILWRVKNNKGWGMDYLKDRVLNSHAANPPNYKLLLKVASPEVTKLWDQVWDINNELNGTKNLNPRNIQAEYRYLCNSCSGNPEIGHYYNCHAWQNDDFDAIVTKDELKSWYRAVEDEDWQLMNWKKWEKTATNAVFLPDFTIKNIDEITVDVTFRLQFSINVEPKDKDKYGPWVHSDAYYQTWMTPFNAKELDDFLLDPVAVVRGFKDNAYTCAMNNYRLMSAHSNVQDSELRVIPLNARIQYYSSLQGTWHTIQLPDPFNSPYKRVKLLGCGTDQLVSVSQAAAAQIASVNEQKKIGV